MRRAPGVIALVALTALVGVAYPLPHSITLVADPPEAGAVSGGGLYADGAMVVLKAEPLPGFAFLRWTEDDVEFSREPQVSFAASSSRAFTAHFLAVPFFEGMSGTWTGQLALLPVAEFQQTRLRLQSGFLFGRQPWSFGVEARGGAAGLVSLTASVSADVADLRFGGHVHLDPATSSYRSALLSVSYRAPGLLFVGSSRHTPVSGFMHTLSLRAGPVATTVRFSEGSTGISFADAVVRVSAATICCDVPVSAALFFSKEGFQFLEVSARDVVRLEFAGVSLGGLIRYGVSQKTVVLRPRSRLFDDACVRIYGDVQWNQWALAGVEIHGFRIRCRFSASTGASALQLELVTAFEPGRLAWARFRGTEFEYWRVGLTMPGCCGGRVSSEFTVYFGDEPSLFSVSRLLLDTTVPLYRSLDVSAGLEVDVVGHAALLRIGWTLAL